MEKSFAGQRQYVLHEVTDKSKDDEGIVPGCILQEDTAGV
jgi:hypothetical protein